MTKIVLFGLLISLAFGSFATASTDNKSPEIQSITPWPSDVGHGEEVYVDAKISGTASVESAWAVVSSNGERVTSTPLTDRNNDGYYVTPVAFTAEGGNTYEVTVKAGDAQGNQASDSVRISSKCIIGIAQTCFY